MKKTYINPELEIVKIVSHVQLLAGSTENVDLVDETPTEWGAREFTLDEEEFELEEDFESYE